MIAEIKKSEVEYLDLAGIFFQKNDVKKAKKILLEAVKIYPKATQFYYNLGLIYAQEGQYRRSIVNYKKVTMLSPNFELGHLNLGVICIKTNQIDNGIKSFMQLLKISPYNWGGYYNLGLALQKKGDFDQALEMLSKAREINPHSADTLFQLGLLSIKIGSSVIGEQYIKEALTINPGLNESVSASLYYLSKRVCDWEGIEKKTQELDNFTSLQLDAGGPIDESPFINIARCDDKDRNLEIAKRWSQTIEDSVKYSGVSFDHRRKKSKGERIRVGYLSYDFRDHPIGSLIVDLFRYHDRARFEVYAYSYGPNDKGDNRKKIEKYTEHFYDLYKVPHKKIAKKIYSDKIDILVDLVGYTGFEKSDIVAFRPAPVQINYLGFPGSTGAGYINYVLADKIVVPPNEKEYYSEKVIYMPNCYQICTPQKSSKISYTREDCSLPADEKRIVFCCFNRPEKIEKPMFDLWIRILQRVTGSVLWLYADSQLLKDNLKKYFQNSGLEGNRLIFAERVPFEEHLSRAGLADISLDTQPYSGGGTTANMLWANVPVITIYGKHFLSRMSSSILCNLGLSELVTKNLLEYEDLAVKLATNKNMLAETKNKIVKNKSEYPLFDSRLFTGNLEKIYQEIWHKYLTCKTGQH